MILPSHRLDPHAAAGQSEIRLAGSCRDGRCASGESVVTLACLCGTHSVFPVCYGVLLPSARTRSVHALASAAARFELARSRAGIGGDPRCDAPHGTPTRPQPSPSLHLSDATRPTRRPTWWTEEWRGDDRREFANFTSRIARLTSQPSSKRKSANRSNLGTFYDRKTY
jgi:hypothetical protein